MDVIATWRQWRHWPASIRHLKVFDSVVQLRGVQRAAKECHVSQPAVTQAIAKLEQQMGVALLCYLSLLNISQQRSFLMAVG